MFAIGVVVFREIIEISLILGIVASSIKTLPNQRKILSLGIAAGILFALIFAVGIDNISDSFEGYGQEIFNASICFMASILIGHTVIWMQRHPQKISHNLRELSQRAQEPAEKINRFLPLGVVFIIAATIFREGAEIILFSAGIYSSHKIGIDKLTIGALTGAGLGIILGYCFYRGLTIFSLKKLFKITSALLILLAANMAAQFIRNLIAADILPDIMPQLWNSSFILSQNSFLGNILNNVIGYVDKPSLLEVVFYFGTIIIILSLKNHFTPPEKI